MNISEFIIPEAIEPNLESNEKFEVLKELSEKMGKVYNLPSEKIYNLLKAREELSSTAVDGGIAIPHARYSDLDKVYGFLACSTAGIDFNSPDGLKTKIFFVLLSPEKNSGLHLMALAKISRLFQDDELKQTIIKLKNKQKIWNTLVE